MDTLDGAPDRTYPGFSEAELTRHHAEIRARMDTADVETVVFCGRGSRNPEIFYLTNWLSTREAWVVLPREGELTMLIQLSNHLPLAKLMSAIPDVRFGGSASSGSVDTIPTLVGCLEERGIRAGRVGLVGPITWREHARLSDALPDIEWVDFGAQMREQRQVKSEEEMALLRRSAEMCDWSAQALEQARPGMTEHQLGQIVEDTYLPHGGINGIHFMVSTSMADPRGGVPCQHLSDRVLRSGDALVVELSTNYMGYSAQILRTYTIDAEPTPLYAEMHDVAMEVFDRVAAVIKDGSTVSDILDAAEIASERGFTIYDDLVHGAAQLPAIVRTRDTYRGEPEGFRYREGMCLVIQPNIVNADASAGVQFGEMLRVTADGLEPLHHYRRELIRCGA